MTAIRLGPGAEFDRIGRIADRLGAAAGEIGDDCARLPEGAGELLVSTDMSIEGVHFQAEWLSWEEVGWRAAAAALSDLAACAAAPIGILVSVAVSRESPERAEDIMAGAAAAAASVGGRVLGGDLSHSPVTTIDVTVLGRSERPVWRRGATPGDRLWVTGCLGDARAAVEAWMAAAVPVESARRRFVRPTPRVAEGRWLSAHGAHAMIDLSDGLAGDAAHLSAASGVSLLVDLDRVPCGVGARSAAAARVVPPQIFAAEGGEDYELLVALPTAFGEQEAAAFRAAQGLSLTCIGSVREGTGLTLVSEGREVTLGGYDHFRL